MPDSPDFTTLLHQRYSRRSLLQGLAGGAAAFGLHSLCPSVLQAATSLTPLGFRPVPAVLDAAHHLAPGYSAHVIARWADALHAGDSISPVGLTPDQQERAFGYNNDFVAFLPLPYGSRSSTRGLLHVNHEYTVAELMFPGITHDTASSDTKRDQIAVEMAAHGGSTLEIIKRANGWQRVVDSPFTRRITATTPMRLQGPAAGHALLQTSADPEGTTVLGTLANCSGGVTPWGTVLMAEENFDSYFAGKAPAAYVQPYAEYTVAAKPYYRWDRTDSRFDVGQEPNEPNRFGWVVEYDPYDPESLPVKHTALGRFKHETATCALAADGRLVVYSGDDSVFQHLYRYVSAAKVDKTQRQSNSMLLDEGTLSAARFNADGTLDWLPLIAGKGPLTAANGFASQAEVLIYARKASRLLGATPMDRPEGIAIHPIQGGVYISLTKNLERKVKNSANPRLNNRAGQILHLTPPIAFGKKPDHAADRFHWDMFLLAGDPAMDKARYGKKATQWLANPDNLAFDPAGNLWVATDGMRDAYKVADGLFGMAVRGEGKAAPHCLYRAPIGAEVTGPCFTPDGKTLFLSVQHPGENGTYDDPQTRWPDFDPALPMRPSVIAITKDDGGIIGT